MAERENRRIKVTRKLFRDALVELMEELPLDKITVTEVCKRADMNRSTFYSHYRDVSELLDEVETEVLRALPMRSADTAATEEQYLRKLEGFFECVRENARLLRTLIVQSEGSGFFHRLVEEVVSLSVEGTAGSTLRERYAFSFCVNGVVGILKDWVGSDFPISARDFARVVVDFTYDTLRTDTAVFRDIIKDIKD